MKTAVKAALVLAAVFFALPGRAAVTVISTAWYSSSSEAESACLAAAGGTGCGTSFHGTYYSYYRQIAVDGGWNTHEYRYNGFITNPCVAPEVVQESDGSCAIPPPEVDCGREAGKRIMGKVSNVNQANLCLPAGQLVDPNAPFSNENFVNGECAAVLSSDGATVVTGDFYGSGGEMLTEYTFTGQACGAGETPNPDIPAPVDDSPPEDTVCMTGSSGGVACLSKTPGNCGEFNGKRICVDSPPPGNCTFVSGSSWACDSTAPTPPKPPVDPEFIANGRGKTGQPVTTHIFPRGAEGGDSNSTLTGGGTASGNGEGGACGGEGQPGCKIDEEGTPTVEEGEFDGASGALDGALEGAEGAAGDAPVSGGEASGSVSAIQSAMPSSGSCSPIIWELPGGNSMTIDLYDKCSDFRAAAAWVLGLATALYLMTLFLRSPGG